ncbi:MAG: RNA polymerase sigma factor [Mycobacteriales bacterium]
MRPADARTARFTAVYDAHRHGVRAFFRARHRDDGAADELMQEVFLRAWRNIDHVAGLDDGAQRAWLCAVARNLSTDAYRSRATRAATATQLRAVAATAAPHTESAADDAARRATVATLGRAIDALPQEQRVVVGMSAVGGLTSAEIGQALEIPAGTVRYRLSMARRTLSTALHIDDGTAEDFDDARA